MTHTSRHAADAEGFVDLQERLTRRFGPGVADWCAGLPALARSLALHRAPVPPGYPQDLRAHCEGFFDRVGRAVAPIVAITYVMRPGSQAAVAELLALSSE